MVIIVGGSKIALKFEKETVTGTITNINKFKLSAVDVEGIEGQRGNQISFFVRIWFDVKKIT
jgi:hypothetical protein